MTKRLLLLLTLPLLLHARKAIEGPLAEAEKGPWFTGPLLTASAHVVPVGHQNYEPYVLWNTIDGSYNNHWHFSKISSKFKTMLSRTAWQFGVLPSVELDITTQFAYNNHHHQHAWHIFDQSFAFGFQLLLDKPDRWYPAIKFHVGATIPIGRYDRLDPKKFMTDVAGGGNWSPNIAFVISRLYNFGGGHYLSWRTLWGYTVPLPTVVHGLSIYGGFPTTGPIKGTRGTVYRGNSFMIQQGFEYTLTHNWVLACDLQYVHNNKNRFSGYSPPGTAPTAPSSEEFSIAPAIEYNFNVNIGLIAGPHFSLAGRNSNFSPAFIAWIFAINIYN
jgi:hypothetical protein